MAYALLSGNEPFILKEFSWDCFIAGHGLIQCTHLPHDTQIRAFAETAIDTKLHDALRDLHAFSCLSNLAYQTTRKLSPDTYNQMMISILYRLTHLSFPSDPLQEAMRTGLLAFSSAIFMQRQFMGQPCDHLRNLYSNAFFRLCKAPGIDLPVLVALWLAVLSHLVAHQELSRKDWRTVWLDVAISRAGIDSWSQAREILRSVMWVDFIHDRLGEKVVGSALLRLGKAPGLDAECATL